MESDLEVQNQKHIYSTSRFVPIFTLYHERIPTSAETKSFQSRELAVMGSFFFCEICNSVCEYGDPVWLEHQEELKFHKIKRMLLLRCANCGTVVVDAFAEFSLERNEFWCRNCIETIGYVTFRSAT